MLTIMAERRPRDLNTSFADLDNRLDQLLTQIDQAQNLTQAVAAELVRLCEEISEHLDRILELQERQPQ